MVSTMLDKSDKLHATTLKRRQSDGKLLKTSEFVINIHYDKEYIRFWISLNLILVRLIFIGLSYTWNTISGSGPMSLTDVEVHLADVTSVTDEDTNSIQTDDANRTIQGNVAMQVAPPGGQNCNLCKWQHLLV